MPSIMQDWFDSELGRYILDKERTWYDEQCADIFGFNAMQFGLCRVDLLRCNRMPVRFCADVGVGGLRCQACALPIATHSLDLLLLPHVLEFSANPHEVLREAERCLRPEGRLLLSGFNPMSLWGLCRLLKRADSGYPWHGQFLSLARIKDWLALMGFEPAAGRMVAYAPPIDRAEWLRRFAFLEAAGDRWWALGGGVYLIHAIKRRRGMRLITPRWDEGWRGRSAVVNTLPKAHHCQEK